MKIKKLVSYLPSRYKQELRRIYYRYQISRNIFKSNEIEFGILSKWVKQGDWVLDIGANIGHYTLRLSEKVGITGRVLAFEPVLKTFELLAANVILAQSNNVTLFNVAVSESTETKDMFIPIFDTGLEDFYSARLINGIGGMHVFCLNIDSLNIPKQVKFIKIDIEGHEIFALRGMKNLITRDHPILIIEGCSEEVRTFLEELGYSFSQEGNSPNRIFEYQK